jgi:hypothetical protein
MLQAAGTLPNESQPVIVQLIFFFYDAHIHTHFVNAAYNKSVPTAVDGGTEP